MAKFIWSRKKHKLFVLIICGLVFWFIKQQVLLEEKRKRQKGLYWESLSFVCNDLINTFELSVFFLIIFKREVFNNFYIKLLTSAFVLNSNFLHFFNFFCLYGRALILKFNELIFRSFELNFRLTLRSEPFVKEYFYSGFFNYLSDKGTVLLLSCFYMKADVLSFLFLKEDLESYRCIKYHEYVSQNLKISFLSNFKAYFLSEIFLTELYLRYLWSLMRKKFKIYYLRLSTSTVLYSMNPVILFFIKNRNSVLNYFQRNVTVVLRIIFNNDIAKRSQLFFYSLVVKFYEDADMLYKYKEYNPLYTRYFNFFYSVLNLNKLCIKSCIELGGKFEKIFFGLTFKGLAFFYFFIDYLNYLKSLNNEFCSLVNKIFNNILRLQFIEYFEDILEIISQNHVGSLRKKGRGRKMELEFFFNNFWQVAYIFFFSKHMIFKFVLVDLNLLNFSIIDYFFWSANNLLKSNMPFMNSFFRENVFDFLYYSRLRSNFDFFKAFANNFFINGIFDFNFYFLFLSLRDLFFKIIGLSSRLSVCYYFISKILGILNYSGRNKVFIDLIKFKNTYMNYFFLWFLERNKKIELKGKKKRGRKKKKKRLYDF